MMDQKYKQKMCNIMPWNYFKISSKFKKIEQTYSFINEKLLKHLLFHCDITNDANLFIHNTQHCPEHMRESTAQAINLE